MSRLTATRLRTRLRVLLAGTSMLLLLPLIVASLHLARVMDLNRRLGQVEAAEARAAPATRAGLAKELQGLRRRMDGLGDRAFRDIISLAALSLVALVALTLVVPGKLLQPLSRLAGLIRQAEGGNLRVVLDRVEEDEIGELTRRLHRMLQELERFDGLKRGKIAALAAQRNQLLDLLQVPAAIIDGEGRLLQASESFRTGFGLEEGALQDQRLFPAMGWSEAILGELATAEEIEADLGEQRYRVRALPQVAEPAAHRLLVFKLVGRSKSGVRA